MSAEATVEKPKAFEDEMVRANALVLRVTTIYVSIFMAEEKLALKHRKQQCT